MAGTGSAGEGETLSLSSNLFSRSLAAVSFLAADHVSPPLFAGAGRPDGDFGGLAGKTIEENYNDYNFYNRYNVYILLPDQYGHTPTDELVKIPTLKA